MRRTLLIVLAVVTVFYGGFLFGERSQMWKDTLILFLCTSPPVGESNMDLPDSLGIHL